MKFLFICSLLTTLDVQVPNDDLLLTTFGVRPDVESEQPGTTSDSFVGSGICLAPEYALKEVPDYDFRSLFREFTFASFIAGHEAVPATMVGVRTLCQDLLKEPGLLETNLRIVMKIDDLNINDPKFRSMKKYSESRQRYLKDNWSESIKKHIETKLADVGPGW